MNKFDLAIAWNWEYDIDFITGIERECALHNITTFRIDDSNLALVLDDLKQGKLKFKAFYDRASDADPEYLPLVTIMTEQAPCLINPHHRVIHAIDKATMHLEFITHGLNVPNTIILPPYSAQKQINLTEQDLNRIGKPFVIKPANTTGGGTGVILNATEAKDIFEARQQHINDKYLIQETIYPTNLDGKRGWFRVYYAFGEIIPCWWDDITHCYTELTSNDETKFNLKELYSIMNTISKICVLDFFSSEISLTDNRKFIVVDYVNEVCDMRLKSKHFNGAIDNVVHRIERLIVKYIVSHIKNNNNTES